MDSFAFLFSTLYIDNINNIFSVWMLNLFVEDWDILLWGNVPENIIFVLTWIVLLLHVI